MIDLKTRLELIFELGSPPPQSHSEFSPIENWNELLECGRKAFLSLKASHYNSVFV